MEHTYACKGTCSRSVSFEMDDDHIVTNIRFNGGCSGNTQGVGRLAEGRKAEELIASLQGIRCGFKPTSCPDQLSLALQKALAETARAL